MLYKIFNTFVLSSLWAIIAFEVLEIQDYNFFVSVVLNTFAMVVISIIIIGPKNYLEELEKFFNVQR